MTIQELYEKIGGNYDQAVRVMRKDKLIDKYVRKFEKNDNCNELIAATETMDAKGIFDAAHAMKGVCANLGFDDLSNRAGELTEEFRAGNPRSLSDEEVREKVAGIKEVYSHTIDEIRAYAAES